MFPPTYPAREAPDWTGSGVATRGQPAKLGGEGSADLDTGCRATWHLQGSRTFDSSSSLSWSFGGGPSIDLGIDCHQDFVVPLATPRVFVGSPAGDPVDGATVRVSSPGHYGASPTAALSPVLTAFSADWQGTAVTGPDGWALVPAIQMTAAHKGLLTASPPGGSTWRGSGEVAITAGGGDLTVALKPGSVDFTGRVSRSDGFPLPYPVVMFGAGGNSADSSGNYRVAPSIGTTGEYTVTCRAQQGLVIPDALCPRLWGGPTVSADVARVQDFRLPMDYQSFRVVDSSGDPIRNARLSLVVEDGSRDPAFGPGTVGLIDGAPNFNVTWRGLGTTGEDGWAVVPGIAIDKPVAARLSITTDPESRHLGRIVSVTAGSDADLVVVLSIRPPEVSSVAPLSAAPGATITLTGSNFVGATGVTIGGEAAPYTVASDTEIRVRLPSSARSGPLTVTNGGGEASAPQEIEVLVSDFSITTLSLPRGMQRTAYRYQLEVSGSGAPYTWARIAGGLPRGLTLSSEGVISGVPTTAGNWTFSVMATDAVGQQQVQTLSLGVDALPYTVPGPVPELTATPSAGRVTLAWVAPLSNGGNPITGYRIQRSADGGSTWSTLISHTNSTVLGTSFLASPSTPYWYRVAAWNAAGLGPYVPSQTPSGGAIAGPVKAVGPSAAPVEFSAVGSVSRVDLTWTTPTDDGGTPIVGYRVRQSTDGVTWTTVIPNTRSVATSATLARTDLTSLYWQVAAINAAGLSPYVTTEGAVGASSVPPGPPAEVQLTPSAGALEASWSAPDLDGGRPITGYRVQRSSDGVTWTTVVSQTPSSETRWTVRVPDASGYWVRVAAWTAAGMGPYSTQAGPTSPGSDVPGVPEMLSAQPGVGGVELSWDPPADIGGAPITGYRVQRSFDGRAWTTVVAHSRTTTTRATVSLLDRRTIFVRVAAWNESGLGAFGPSVGPAGALSIRPDHPHSVEAIAGPSRITVTWSEPGDNGGADISAYRIQRSLDGVTWVTASTVPGSARQVSFAVTGGRAYVVRVAAVNAAGVSDNSSPSTPVTPTTVAGSPLVVDARSTAGRVELTWSAPVSDGGSPVTGYRIQRSVDGLNWLTLVSNTRSPATSFIDRSATSADLNFTYRVAAWNASGLGVYSPASRR